MKPNDGGVIQAIRLSELRGRLIVIITSLVTLSVLGLGLVVFVIFDRAIEPEISNRTRLIGSVVREEMQRVLDLGIPLNAVSGLDAYLFETLKQFEEVQSITVANARGDVVAQAKGAQKAPGRLFIVLGDVVRVQAQSFELPILAGNRLAGSITVEISPRFVQTKLRDVFLDIGVLALVSVLVAVELALSVVVNSVGKPMDRVLYLLGDQRRGNYGYLIRTAGVGGLKRVAIRLNDHALDLGARAAKLPESLRDRIGAIIPQDGPVRLRLSDFNDIRLAVFLFALGTEVAAAFMPLFARSMARPEWLSAEIAAAAPLIFYLGAIAVMAPFGSRLVNRFGALRLFLISAPGAGVALAGLAFSSTIAEVTFWQGIMAGFYATATIAGQEYAIRAASEEDRAKAVGAFVAVAYGGLFAGSALGGLIAGRFGFEAAFIAGAVLTLLSIFLGLSAMNGRAGDKIEKSRPEALPQALSSGSFWINPRYLALLLGVAVPMNVTMVVYIWYLSPLMLADLGSGPAEIARVLVLYNVAIFLLGPTIARLADGKTGPFSLLTLGALISSGSILSLMAWSGFWAIAVAVAGVGIGQVLMQTPIFAMALKINRGPGPGIDALRLIERLGAIAGLLLGAVFLAQLGAETCLLILGVTTLFGIVICGIVEIWSRWFEKEKVPES